MEVVKSSSLHNLRFSERVGHSDYMYIRIVCSIYNYELVHILRSPSYSQPSLGIPKKATVSLIFCHHTITTRSGSHMQTYLGMSVPKKKLDHNGKHPAHNLTEPAPTLRPAKVSPDHLVKLSVERSVEVS